jgi:dihydroxy-acid dehydratase
VQTFAANQKRQRTITKVCAAGEMMTKPTSASPTAGTKRKLRSSEWFNDPHNPGMTALYLERYLNYGLTRHELQSGKPIIGIAQTGNDLSPCNRHHIELAKRVREGITAAGGLVMEFPVHPIQETGKRPTAALDRNLAYLGLVEVLFGYPLDGVVLTTGCDKTTPACLMAAATVNLPAIVLSGGPMLNGWHDGQRTGSGTVVWKSRERLAAGEIDYEEFMTLQHHGHGFDHEFAGGSARHVAARLRRHSRALPRARPDRL